MTRLRSYARTMYGHAIFLATLPLARYGKEAHMRTTDIGPGEVRREIDVWLARSPRAERALYLAGKRSIRLSDGRLVRRTTIAGYLRVDGKVEYSAAWL